MAHKNRSNWSPYLARKSRSSGTLSKADEKAATSKPGSPKAPSSTTPNSKPRTTKAASGARSGSPSEERARDNRPQRSQSARPDSARQETARPESARHGRSHRGQHRRPEENYSFYEADDRIYSVFRNHGFGDYPHAKRQELTRFYQLMMEKQKTENFTRLHSLRDVAIKHFIDSLMVTRLTELRFPLLDMGTGPGVPGIPLKIHYPDQEIVLAEGVQRRVEFLKMVRDTMHLKQLPIIGQNINSEFFYPVNGVITRAVEDARNTLGNVINSLQTGGRVYLMKGPQCGPEIDMALEAWGEYYELESDIAYELPKTPHERRLLIFRKIKPHPLPDFEELDLAWEREHGSGIS